MLMDLERAEASSRMCTVGRQYKVVVWQCLTNATTVVVVMVVNKAMHHGLTPGYSGSKGECSGGEITLPEVG